MGWLNRLLGRDVHTSAEEEEEDAAQLLRTRLESERLRLEAEALLEDAQCHADLMRGTRREDNYIDIIDALFRGESHAHD